MKGINCLIINFFYLKKKLISIRKLLIETFKIHFNLQKIN